MNLLAASKTTTAIPRWKPYPGYKHSGVEWLGNIPAHWNASTLKLLAPIVHRGKSPDYVEEGGIPVINQACVYWEGLRLESIKYDSGKDGNDGKGRLFPGDVLVNSTGTGTLGRASVFREEGIYLADGHVTVVRMDQIIELPEYFFYLLQTPIYQGFIYAALVSGSTNQIELSRENFRATPTIAPPVSEQVGIVAFLDRETAKIDALVTKKQRLIELLQEKRAALITRVVTKGLPSTGSEQVTPNVPMKDSGVEWLGEIPAYWESVALSRVTLSKCDGPFGSGLKSEHYSEDGVRVIRLQNIGWTEFLDQDRAYIGEHYATQLGDHSVVSDDLLVAGLGDEGHPVGRACVAPHGIEPAMVKADCFRFRLDRRRVFPPFAAYQLSATALAAGGSLATGATRARMNLTTTANRKIGLPPLDEQRIIVEVLDRQTEQHAALVAKIREGIEKLKEYRTALISGAVTGKIDVRKEIPERADNPPSYTEPI